MMTNTYLPHVGGVARSVSTFADEYRKLGHGVLVVAPEFEGRKPPRKQESIVERVAAIQNFNGSDFSVRLPFAASLSARIDAFAADLIHAHHPFLLGETALRVARSKNVPIVFTHHTKYEDYTHYLSSDSPVVRQGAISLSTEFANLCDGVIAPSQSIAALIRRRGVKVPIAVVPTGIDVSSFASGRGPRFRKRFKIPAKAFVIGHVGRLAPEKNLPFLAEAAAQAVKKIPGAYFLVVGGGPSEDTLKAIFEKQRLARHLILAGKHQGESLHDAYNAMDVFTFSSFSETQGMVVAEAMAAGRPVVALKASGVREVVQDGKNGFLLPKQAKVPEFAARLRELHRQPALRAAFSDGARATAETFSREHCARLAVEFYETVRRATRRERLLTDLNPFGALLKRVGVEWDLLAEKARTLADALAKA